MSHLAKPAKAVSRKKIEQRYQDMDTIGDQYSNQSLARINDMRSAFFAGIDPRRRQEAADAGMIREDNQEMSNLPRKFIHTEYPPEGFYCNPFLDDQE